jgi:hypothetical protein
VVGLAAKLFLPIHFYLLRYLTYEFVSYHKVKNVIDKTIIIIMKIENELGYHTAPINVQPSIFLHGEES